MTLCPNPLDKIIATLEPGKSHVAQEEERGFWWGFLWSPGLEAWHPLGPYGTEKMAKTALAEAS